MTGEDDPVFASPLGGHLDGSALRRRFVDATRRAGLRTLPFHSLRHFFGSMAVNKGSLVQVQTWMGHAHIQTTARYLHHRAQHSDAALLADAFRATSPAAPTSGRVVLTMLLHDIVSATVLAKQAGAAPTTMSPNMSPTQQI
jgi:site-specific recombinase XerC